MSAPSRISITRRYQWSCSHQLWHLPAGHRCSNLHGHNMECRVTVSRALPLDAVGMAIEAGILDQCIGALFAYPSGLDHQHLNALPFKDQGAGPEYAAMKAQPTAENVALWLFASIAASLPPGVTLVRVVVAENDRLSAEVEA